MLFHDITPIQCLQKAVFFHSGISVVSKFQLKEEGQEGLNRSPDYQKVKRTRDRCDRQKLDFLSNNYSQGALLVYQI